MNEKNKYQVIAGRQRDPVTLRITDRGYLVAEYADHVDADRHARRIRGCWDCVGSAEYVAPRRSLSNDDSNIQIIHSYFDGATEEKGGKVESSKLIFGGAMVPTTKPPIELIHTGLFFMGQSVLLEKPANDRDAEYIKSEFILQMGLKNRKAAK
ncbi:MAG: hypothetical protein ACRC2U_13040 [Aeromonas sp.]